MEDKFKGKEMSASAGKGGNIPYKGGTWTKPYATMEGIPSSIWDYLENVDVVTEFELSEGLGNGP